MEVDTVNTNLAIGDRVALANEVQDEDGCANYCHVGDRHCCFLGNSLGNDGADSEWVA